MARREAESSERDLLRVAQLYSERNNRDSRELGKISDKIQSQNEQLREDVATRWTKYPIWKNTYILDVFCPIIEPKTYGPPITPQSLRADKESREGV